jgi:hypothetical protein
LLFVPALVRLDIDSVAHAAQLPGSQMMPAGHALRASLALKLWSIERKSHVMALVADEGLGLFCGLNRLPKKSYLSEYSARIDHTKTTTLLAGWHAQVTGEGVFRGHAFDLDFHSVPYDGEHPVLERHYVSARSRRQPSVLVFLAQDAAGRAFCSSHADMRQGEDADAVLRVSACWPRLRGAPPQPLGCDSRLTTSKKVARLDAMGLTFITVRRRSPSMLREIEALPRSAWRQVKLDVPTRQYRTPRVYEKTVQLEGRSFRQLSVLDLGHDEPTVLLTNEGRTAVQLITRYAQRLLIENALADSVRFFHMDALSSAVGLKVDFDMAFLVIARGLYRLLAASMRGYSDSQARQIFRDRIDMPADVHITASEVAVRLHRRAHLPIILASGLLDKAWAVPWWHGRPLRMTT